MKKMKFLSATLAFLLLFGSLTACGESLEGTETRGATEPESVWASETESATDMLRDRLPDDLNYQKDEVVIISRDREGWTTGEISVKELTGDAVNDAVYERNLSVEERLGVRIVNILDQNAGSLELVTRVATSVAGGSHEYDIMAAPACTALNETLNGTFADLRDTKYLDFDMPWWSQGFHEAVVYHDSQYAVTGSAVLALYRFAFATIFNKDIFTDAGVEYLYTDVRNQTWTLDRQNELIPLFHRDNGNGVQDLEGDVYGFVSSYYLNVDPYWSACNVRIVTKNDEGDYELTFNAGELHDVADKLLRIFYDNGNATYSFAPNWDYEQEDIRDMFAAGGAAMTTLRLMELESASVRNMSDRFGVVPMPKYSVEQEDYGTILHDQFTVFCIPTTIQEERFDEMSAVLEALCSNSYHTVRPAYYEKTLRTQIAQDPESAEMMDIVIDHIYIDTGIIYTYALESFHDKFRGIIGSKTNTVISDYKTQSMRAQRSLDKMTKKLDHLVD